MLAICCTSSQLISIRALLPISRHGAASTRDFIFPSLAVRIVFVNPFPVLCPPTALVKPGVLW